MVYPDADGVIVAYSGGKDSLCVLDLAVQHYRRVEAFFMYFVPGLEYTRVTVDYAEQRFGIKVRLIPHWCVAGFLYYGAFRDEVDDVKQGTMQERIGHVRALTGLQWCGVGYRIQESLMQRRWLSVRKGWKDGLSPDGRWAPIYNWSTKQVIAHLRGRRITVPGMSASENYRPSGIDLSSESLSWLRRAWPRDYEVIIATFPWAAAEADRADAYIAARNAARKQLKP